ncbi:MAG: hypothetical protein Q9207_008525, partial [Kuettlingeria erythrocarpa]
MDHPSYNNNSSESRSRYGANLEGPARNQSKVFTTSHKEQHDNQDTYLRYGNGSGFGQGVTGPTSDDILYRQLHEYLQAEAGSLPARIPITYGGPPSQWGFEQGPSTEFAETQPYDDYVNPFDMQYQNDPYHEQQPLYHQEQGQQQQQQSQTGGFYGQNVVPSYTSQQINPYEQEQATYHDPQQQQSGQPTMPTHQPAFNTGHPDTAIVPSALPASSSRVWKGHGKLVPTAATKQEGSPLGKSRRAAPGAKRARKTVDTAQPISKRQQRTPDITAGSLAAPQGPSSFTSKDPQPTSSNQAHPSIPKGQRRTPASTAGSYATPQ